MSSKSADIKKLIAVEATPREIVSERHELLQKLLPV
jgi:hypothetical protein